QLRHGLGTHRRGPTPQHQTALPRTPGGTPATPGAPSNGHGVHPLRRHRPPHPPRGRQPRHHHSADRPLNGVRGVPARTRTPQPGGPGGTARRPSDHNDPNNRPHPAPASTSPPRPPPRREPALPPDGPPTKTNRQTQSRPTAALANTRKPARTATA